MDYRQVVDATQTAQPAVRPDNASYLASVNRISVLFALILGAAVWWDRNSAITAVITAGITYGTVVVLLILFQPGAVPFIAVSFMREVTIRRRDKMEFRLFEAQGKETQQVQVVDRLQLPCEAPAPPQLPDSPNFVPAEPNQRQIAKEAAYWVAVTLYLDNGEPNPDRVNLKGGTEAKGRLKTAAPSNPDVKQFLLDRRVLLRVRQGVALNLESYPNRESLRWLTR